MKCSHYRNKPVEDVIKVAPGELERYLLTAKIHEKPLADIHSCQVVNIDVTSFMLTHDYFTYPVGVSDKNTHPGEYFVVEKWEYPYWRKNGEVYLPSEQNPIGKHLVILAERKSLRKSSISIHAWPLPPYASDRFIKGNHSKGCIRLKKENMASFFEILDLGAQVNIYR